MEIIALLIPIALIFLTVAIGALFWALKKDQFEDLDNAAWRVIFDDQQRARKPTDRGDPDNNDTTQQPEDTHHR